MSRRTRVTVSQITGILHGFGGHGGGTLEDLERVITNCYPTDRVSVTVFDGPAPPVDDIDRMREAASTSFSFLSVVAGARFPEIGDVRVSIARPSVILDGNPVGWWRINTSEGSLIYAGHLADGIYSAGGDTVSVDSLEGDPGPELSAKMPVIRTGSDEALCLLIANSDVQGATMCNDEEVWGIDNLNNYEVECMYAQWFRRPNTGNTIIPATNYVTRESRVQGGVDIYFGG